MGAPWSPPAREVDVPGVDHRRRADQVLQHCRAQVVHHDPAQHPAEGLEGMFVARQEELHCL
jgi:hypothetical protein